MCGIVGYCGEQEAATALLQGLRTLEYRGYDSAGVSVLNGDGLQVRRSVGKLDALERLLTERPVHGHLGLGHTRWATHGEPSVMNAHPHTDSSGRIAVVHNGIIENYAQLKKKLQEQGIAFQSETDTEVVAQLIGYHWNAEFGKNGPQTKGKFIKAVQTTLDEIRGTYALGIMCSLFPEFIIGARRECPLIVGITKNELFMASDFPALLSHTRDVIVLEDGDLAVFNEGSFHILDGLEKKVRRDSTRINWDPIQAEKGPYPHFMIKEIHEQPRVAKDTIMGYGQDGRFLLDESALSKKEAEKISDVHLIACGTSWHAGLIGSYWIEKWANLPAQASTASEFRYRDTPLNENSVVLAISQSGETADTLAAIRLAKNKGAKVISVANVAGSTLTRESNSTLLTRCGPEIGVASTKAFLGQLVVLNLFGLHLARLRRSMTSDQLESMGRALSNLPQLIHAVLKNEPQIKSIAKKYFQQTDFLYLGRHLNFPVALEGALKLKEISYVHAEGYPAGEMKHGPIALIREKTPVVAIATQSSTYEKMLSNVEEVRSRHADVIAIATEGDDLINRKAADVITVPWMREELAPMVNVIPLQLLAYHIAVLRDCDVDKPRNLAKSVTVE